MDQLFLIQLFKHFQTNESTTVFFNLFNFENLIIIKIIRNRQSTKMGRGIRTSDLISDDKNRRLTFKKRRIGLLKKAMQLSLISGCEFQLKIFWQEDGSLVEYESNKDSGHKLIK